MTEKNVENMEFEEALGELEIIVRSFEDRNVRLKEAISSFDRGKLLYEHCTSKLKEAENRLRIYENGELVEEENN